MATQPIALGIRKATSADSIAIRLIAQKAYSKYIPRLGRPPAPMLADFDKVIVANHCVIIEAVGIIVGYLIGWPETETYFIEDIAVDPTQQGRGFGRGLMAHAIAEARRLRLPAMHLYTNVAMTENLAIYGHMGFTETHRTVEDGYDRIYMRLLVEPFS